MYLIFLCTKLHLLLEPERSLDRNLDLSVFPFNSQVQGFCKQLMYLLFYRRYLLWMLVCDMTSG